MTLIGERIVDVGEKKIDPAGFEFTESFHDVELKSEVCLQNSCRVARTLLKCARP